MLQPDGVTRPGLLSDGANDPLPTLLPSARSLDRVKLFSPFHIPRAGGSGGAQFVEDPLVRFFSMQVTCVEAGETLRLGFITRVSGVRVCPKREMSHILPAK